MFFTQRAVCSTLSMREAEQELKRDPSIRLIDVRTAEEYRGGHIPGSLNIPLDQLSAISQVVPDKGNRLFVYCQSGARSRVACSQLSKMGYSAVTNIGGIVEWSGEIERGAIL